MHFGFFTSGRGSETKPARLSILMPGREVASSVASAGRSSFITCSDVLRVSVQPLYLIGPESKSTIRQNAWQEAHLSASITYVRRWTICEARSTTAFRPTSVRSSKGSDLPRAASMRRCATNERHSCCTNNSGLNAQARSRALSISLDRSLIKITAYHSSLTTISLAFFSCSMQIRLHRLYPVRDAT